MSAGALGIRLLLLLGRQIPGPAPYEAMTALTRAQVINDTDGEDGFQLTFALGKGRAGSFTLLRSGLLDPDGLVAIGVTLGAKQCPLILGVISHHQIAPDRDGSFTLTVMGRDLAALLDLETHDKPYPNQTDSEIVKKILGNYASKGLTDLSNVTPTSARPSERRWVPRQHMTDLAYIRELAASNSFVFYLEPATLKSAGAYWGPADRKAPVQDSLIYNLGPASNVTELRFSQDALAPVRAEGYMIDPQTKQSTRIPPPPNAPQTVARPVDARKVQRLRDTLGLEPAQARAALAAAEAAAPDAITTEGALDPARYGAVLRAHRRVQVRGAGRAYDGEYEVRKVVHEIEPGTYTQRFTLGRKGLEKG
jgi:phage protein D